jgi:hypothetical protein
MVRARGRAVEHEEIVIVLLSLNGFLPSVFQRVRYGHHRLALG